MDIRQKIRSEQEAAAAMAIAVAQPVPRRKKQSMAPPIASDTVPLEGVAGAPDEDATMPSGPVARPPRRRPKPATATTATASASAPAPAPAPAPTVATATTTTNPVATALANVSAVEDMAVAKNIAEGLFI